MYCSLNSSFVVVVVVATLFAAAPLVQCLASSKGSGDIGSQIRSAMELTARSSGNITVAVEAAALWSTILGVPRSVDRCPDSISPKVIPGPILAPSLSLQAATLATLGKDGQAIAAFDAALKLGKYLTFPSVLDISMGKGYALQRLMRYKEARDQFLDTLDLTIGEETRSYEFAARAAVAAATCSLRIEDFQVAVDALERYVSFHLRDLLGDVSCLDGEAAGLYGYLKYIESGKVEMDSQSREFELLAYAVKTSPSALYRWLLFVASGKAVPLNTTTKSFSLLDMAAINQSPLDDPRLINLDDKIRLHKLMTAFNVSSDRPGGYTPKGFILPDDLDRLKKYSRIHTCASWIIKERAGYGSHGNYVVPATSQVLELIQSKDEKVLCQRIVEPPLLMDHRKFSMRVYVVLVHRRRNDGDGENPFPDVYLCADGLAKLALSSYQEGVYDMENIDDAYMTNSGRGEENSEAQFDFLQLRKEFERRDWNYDEMWKGISDAVCHTMRLYRDAVKSEGPRPRSSKSDPSPHLPKILGFDFLLDDEKRPWMIEVNRFCGLEPRTGKDEAVKRRLVEDVWRLACDLGNVPRNVVGLKEGKEPRTSLQKLL